MSPVRNFVSKEGKNGISNGVRVKFLIISLFLFVFALINQTNAAKEVNDGTRIKILTSGAAKFSSYWLEDPPRLVVEFKSRNIISELDKEVIVNQGMIKRITSSYFGRAEKRTLKSLTFELTQKVPHKIWQEDDTILIDIQAPLKVESLKGFLPLEPTSFPEGESSDVIIKRIEAMDVALRQITESEAPLETPKVPLETPKVEVIKQETETIEKIKKAEREEQKGIVLPKPSVLPAVEPAVKEPAKARRAIGGWAFLIVLVGLFLISGLGFLIWRKYRLNIDQEFEKLKSELEESDKYLQHERVIRKAVEETSLQREKEYQQLKDSLESLKEELGKKELVQKELSPEEAKEARVSPRLSLTRDFKKTIIVRIESSNKPEKTKSFANNVSLEGLCLETKEEFKEKDPINLRLFFYGERVPIMKIPAQIRWKKTAGSMNYYGVSFDLSDEKDKSELKRYIESKMGG